MSQPDPKTLRAGTTDRTYCRACQQMKHTARLQAERPRCVSSVREILKDYSVPESTWPDSNQILGWLDRLCSGDAEQLRSGVDDFCIHGKHEKALNLVAYLGDHLRRVVEEGWFESEIDGEWVRTAFPIHKNGRPAWFDGQTGKYVFKDALDPDDVAEFEYRALGPREVPCERHRRQAPPPPNTGGPGARPDTRTNRANRHSGPTGALEQPGQVCKDEATNGGNAKSGTASRNHLIPARHEALVVVRSELAAACTDFEAREKGSSWQSAHWGAGRRMLRLAHQWVIDREEMGRALHKLGPDLDVEEEELVAIIKALETAETPHGSSILSEALALEDANPLVLPKDFPHGYIDHFRRFVGMCLHAQMLRGERPVGIPQEKTAVLHGMKDRRTVGVWIGWEKKLVG